MMRHIAIVAAFVTGVAVQAGWASAPERSPRPVARPDAATTEPQVEVARMGGDVIQPRVRPGKSIIKPPSPEKIILASSGAAVGQSIRPAVRPENLKRRNVVAASGMRTQPSPIITHGRKGAVCGMNGIKGVELSPIAGRIKGCGLAEPVRVTSVDGVQLSTPSIMDCTTAKALNGWVSGSVKPSVGRLGGGVTRLKVAAHYACRTRNNKKGAKISEHGRGRAIDISAIGLKNGASISVLKGWRDPQHGKVLKVMHKSACAFFGTVLGPSANKHHQDHFHFDTARYRGGSYCR